MWEIRLRWFGHVMRRGNTEAMKVGMKINVEGNKGRGIPRNSWIDENT